MLGTLWGVSAASLIACSVTGNAPLVVGDAGEQHEPQTNNGNGAPDAHSSAHVAYDSSDGDAGAHDDATVSSDAWDSSIPTGDVSLSNIISKSIYEQMFPNRNTIYEYDALLDAAHAFPLFASEGSESDRRREIAAFFANIGHETTGGWPTAPGGPYAWGLYFAQEVGCEKGACVGYCDAVNTRYPCAEGKSYHGRGPMQLSWNYNYGQAGEAIGLDLLHMPELVATDGRVAFKTALWFWMTPQAPKPSAHHVITGGWLPSAQDTAAGRAPGFGMTVNIINGGLECGIANDARVADRLGFYNRFAQMLRVNPGNNLDCSTMHSY